MIKAYIAGGVFTAAVWAAVPFLKLVSKLDTYSGDVNTLPWIIAQCMIGILTFVIWYIVFLYRAVKRIQR